MDKNEIFYFLLFQWPEPLLHKCLQFIFTLESEAYLIIIMINNKL